MKRTLASILAVLLILSILSPAALCAEQQDDTPEINSILLDAMLHGERHWVIETLVQDSRKNNPLAILQGTEDRKSLARDALDTYEGVDAKSDTYAAIYKGLMDIMELSVNADVYVNGLADEAGNLIGAAAELFTGIDGLKDTISEMTKSGSEIFYDRLLKSALTAEFTASNGVTVGKNESDLIYSRQAQDIINYFGSFIALVNTNMDTLVGMSDAKEFKQKYVTDYAGPYYDAALQYLTSIDALCKDQGGLGSENQMKFVAALASLEAYSIMKPETTFSGFSYKDYLSEFMVDSGIKATFSLMNKVFTIQETALDSYLYVNSLQRQRETIIGPLQRLSASTTVEGMSEAVNNAVNKLDESYRSKLSNYDSIVNYLRSNAITNKAMVGLAKNALKKCGVLSEETLGGAVLAKATTIKVIAEFLADKAVGIKDTCSKTHELIRLQALIDAMAAQYKLDVAAYEKNKTDDAAAMVLDDLLLLQRLRLYGENVAYGLWSAQADSWLGKLFLHDKEPTFYGPIYQNSVDELISASVIPAMQPLEVRSGEQCAIRYDQRVGYYALITPKNADSQGRSFMDAEALSRLAIGADVSGTLFVQPVSGKPVQIGYLNSSGSVTIGALNGSVQIGDLTQSGGDLTLITNNHANIACGQMQVTNCTFEPQDGSVLTVGDLTVNGTLAGEAVTVSGALSGSSGTISAPLTLNGTQPQTISGTLQAKNLTLKAPKVTMDGNMSVTGTLSGGSTAVWKGKNLTLSGGTLLGKTFCGDLRASNASFSDQTIRGVLYAADGVKYTGSVTTNGLVSSCAMTAGKGSVLQVNGDLKLYKGGTLLDGTVIAKSDIDAAEQTAFGDLRLEGKAVQTLRGELVINALHVNCSGADLQGTLRVQELLDYQTGAFTGNPVYLEDDARLNSDTFIGSLSALHWAPEKNGRIQGSLTLRDGGSISGNAAVTGALTASGAASVSGTVSVGSLNSGQSLTLSEDTVLTVQRKATLAGTLNGGTLRACEDVFADGLTAAGTVTVSGDLFVSGATAFDTFCLDGKLPQKVSGSDFEVNTLELRNTSGKLLDVQQVITVKGSYINNGTAVPPSAIRSGAPEPVDGETVYMPGNLTISEGRTFTGGHIVVQGNLTLAGAQLTLAGATLEVQGRLIASGGSIALDENSTLLVMGRSSLSGTPVMLNGTFTARDDLLLTSSAITGKGTLCLRGDLIASSPVTVGTLLVSGLTRQYLNSSGKVLAEQIVFDNPSRGGVVLQTFIYYTQEAKLNDTAIFGGAKLKKEAA